MLEPDLCPERCDGGYSQGFSLRKGAVEQTQREDRMLPDPKDTLMFSARNFIPPFFDQALVKHPRVIFR